MFRRKSGVDTVDFTKTKKGKPIPKPAEEASTPMVGGFLDFTSPAPQSSSTESISPTEAPNSFGFLSDFSQAASTSSSETTSNGAQSSDVTSLKIKIEDLEFKLERLLERLSEIETKFSRI